MNTIPRFKGKIESDTDPGVFYVVDMVEDLWVCTCPAKIAKGENYACKHILRFQAAIKVALNERAKDTAPKKLRSALKKHGTLEKPLVVGEHYDFGKDMRFGRVTSILGGIKDPSGLIKWAARMAATALKTDPEMSIEEASFAPFHFRNKKAKIGTHIHTFVELAHSGKKADVKKLSHDEQPYAYAFLNWINLTGRENITTIAAEMPVYSIKHKYSGTFDWLLKMNDKIVLIDIKTSKYVDQDYALQLVAYKNALIEMDIIDHIDTMAVLHLKPDGTFSFQEMDVDINVFLAALTIWSWRNEIKNGGSNE